MNKIEIIIKKSNREHESRVIRVIEDVLYLKNWESETSEDGELQVISIVGKSSLSIKQPELDKLTNAILTANDHSKFYMKLDINGNTTIHATFT